VRRMSREGERTNNLWNECNKDESFAAANPYNIHRCGSGVRPRTVM
jgi:hypothetical protein